MVEINGNTDKPQLQTLNSCFNIKYLIFHDIPKTVISKITMSVEKLSWKKNVLSIEGLLSCFSIYRGE